MIQSTTMTGAGQRQRGDDWELDFLKQLDERLDIGRGATLAMLGDWLMSYEPVDQAAIGSGARGRTRAA